MRASSQPLAVRPRSCEARSNTLGNSGALELRYRGQDVHLQLAGWSCGVDAFGERHERNPERLHILKQGY
jgi:hypothetical protein